MTVYEDYKCYGPYTRKDGRQHVVLIKHGKNNAIIGRITVSYPKYLVEVYLNRHLSSEETVDHIDGNFSNNNLSNLRIVPRVLHCRSHAKTYKNKLITQKCAVCGKEFQTLRAKGVTCSRVCRGKYSHFTKEQKQKPFKREENDYISLRGLVQEIVSVEDANSVKSLVDNTEQGETRV